MRVTVLGCGSSSGVPMIGCTCPVCSSKNPKNKRTRVSLYIEINTVGLLIDSSPDLRQQALACGVKKADAVLYTHGHADHTHGVDDLRSFNYLGNKELPVYGDADTLASLQQRFTYVFRPKPDNIWVRPCLVPNVIPRGNIVNLAVQGVDIVAFEQLHGRTTSLGYRIDKFAYSTDTHELPESAYKALEGIDVWVVDCLRYTESVTHSHLKRTLEWIARVKPRQAILTHMAHDFDYDKLAAELPPGVVPGYDGMVIDL